MAARDEMQLVDHDTFLRQLAGLFESSKEKGSIWITHKRLTHDGEDASMKIEDEGSEDAREYPCLLRVTDGKVTKFSMTVAASLLPKFYASYGALLKTSLSTNLRKRDKKREKQHAEAAAKRRAKMTTPVKLDGPKRGNGRKRRQRQIKAVQKQEASQEKFKEREEAQRKKAEA